MNKYLKGRINEKWLEDYFCKEGIWNIQNSYKAPHVKFSKTHDIFNMWDGIALDVKTQNVIFWQMKTNKIHYSAFKKKMLTFYDHFVCHNDRIEIKLFLKFDSKMLRVYEIFPGRVIKESFQLIKKPMIKPLETASLDDLEKRW